ncbi:MAG: PadR family transcriptional regulator [Candidatus Dormibacteraeota bacterium]|nr:PadR family transcriptional regulator [Candidatus Dormibacteraeota bacterium]
MSLQGAIAALLLGGPNYGYQLQATLEAELGPLWETKASQLYLVIGRMQRDGFITSQRVRQKTYPDRQLLALTRRGHDLGQRWLTESGPSHELPVRLAVARIAAPARFGEVAEAIAQERAAVLQQLRELKAQAASGFHQEAVELELARVRAELRWVTAVQERADEIVARPRIRRQPLTIERDA